MPASHAVFASSAVSHPSPTVANPVAAGILPPTPSPISVPSAGLDSFSHPRTYYFANTPPDSSGFASSARPPYSSASDAPGDKDPRPAPSQSRQVPFSAASLPRTSSLLPPVRIAPKAAPSDSRAAPPNVSPFSYNPFNAPAPVDAASPPDSAAAAPPSRHRPSRSNSIGHIHEPARNLNRWSNSSGSSRASIAGGHQLYHRHQRSASFSRRLSVDSLSAQVQSGEYATTPASASASAPPPAPQTTPRKLQKHRPGQSSESSPLRDSPGSRSPRPPSPFRIPPLASLPPIVSLPSLEQEVQGGTASFSERTTPQRRPHLRQLSSEDNIQSFYFGDAQPSQSSVPTIRSASAQAGRLAPSPMQVMNAHDGTNGSPSATMYYSRESSAVQTSRPETRPETRSRSQRPNGSTDSTRSTRDRSSRPPSQKAMLSRALQKANTAVQLDNAGNIEGARDAYSDACALLHQVLLKTPGEDDKRKLDGIRDTYTARIDDLDQLMSTQRIDSRPLPKRPSSGSNGVPGRSSSEVYSEDDADARSDAEAGPEEETVIETARMTRIYNEEEEPGPTQPRSIPSYSVPLTSASPRPHQSGFANSAGDQPRHVSSLLSDQYTLQSSFSRSPRKEFAPPLGKAAVAPTATLQPPPSANQYIPPPLSPRRLVPPPKPADEPSTTSAYGGENPASVGRLGSNLRPGSAGADLSGAPPTHGHSRAPSHESVSWLDPINESGSSASSSVHSRSSSMRLRRKHIRATSGATEAEFDAALDDAIEAAYNDGYEPIGPETTLPKTDDYTNTAAYGNDDAQVSQSLRRVELAKQRVRETEREALAFERQLRLRGQLKQQQQQQDEKDEPMDRKTQRDFLDAGDNSDDEERMLEEMTNGYSIDDFAFGLKQEKQQPPRESDSSEFTSRTWHSSLASNPPTATTVLSTVTESTITAPVLAKGSTSTMPPPPTQALPQLPPQQPRPSTAQSPVSAGTSQSVRNRRLSGQNMKQLKIETSKLSPPSGFGAPAATSTNNASNVSSMLSASANPAQQPRAGGFLVQQRQALSAGPSRPGSSAAFVPFSKQTPTPSPGAGATMFFGPSPVDPMPPPNFPPPTPPIPQGMAFGDNDSTAGRSGSPSTARPGLRKNFSSSSLRSMRSRNMSLTNLDGASDLSPGTPLSNQFMLHSSRMPDVPSLPTPIGTTYKDRIIIASTGVGGMRLLDSDFHSPSTPGSPSTLASDAPVPLEPCPTDTMLRPFWLMRCLYQTLVHPRGGYLSNKLFVPSDVWKVKGVRLKNVDEKVANCDFLTSALLKLGQVDTCDADEVLVEMQELEGVLEQVQAVLTRRLGSEVGVQSANALFKDASIGAENDAPGTVPRTASVSGNGRSFSWRRLRSKNSSAGLSSSYNNAAGTRKDGAADGGPKDGSLASLPMTAQPTRRPAKRAVAAAKFTGPNATYMDSLARLFDAAQSIDQIARQVDDPGLRHADKTQVGLELCTRHAAEFFAFYICRFVLSDVSLLLEKFIKRGSEWVLA